eukprot:6205766-Pyramimonas_sp.AAC.1
MRCEDMLPAARGLRNVDSQVFTMPDKTSAVAPEVPKESQSQLGAIDTTGFDEKQMAELIAFKSLEAGGFNFKIRSAAGNPI